MPIFKQTGLCALALLVVVCVTVPGHPQAPKNEEKDDPKIKAVYLADLQAEITVLNVFYLLDARSSQLRGIRLVANKTMQKPPPRQAVKVTPAYHEALTSLRNALAEGDDEKINTAQDKVDRLAQKEVEDLGPEETEVTADARRLAPSALRLFSARQAANYIGSIVDFPDPLESLRTGIEESRKLRGQNWQQLRDDIVAEVGWLIAGLDAENEKKVRSQALALLNRAASLNDNDYQTQREKLNQDARAILGKTAPTDVIKNYMERVLAEVLSSHRLEAAIDLRLKMVNR